MKNLVIKKKIDEETLNKIEEFLIMSDVGVDVASEIRKIISEKKILPNQDSIMQVNQILLNYIEKLMNPLEKEILNNENVGTKVFLIAGVNGVGKTTTIGKLGKILKKNNKKIIFAATDTFRAAAIEQLENWSKKIDVKIIKSETGSDPASVAFKALEFAIKNNFDYVLIDTAGRLQNKKNLMEEYKKISNVTKKIDPNSPHEVLLILDATTGQNALIQVEEFQKIAPITGIIMTKLDGTAKGGILIALAKKFNLPIIALGLGEKEDDLQIFNSKDFAKALININ
jgi:fused signal recognition particle receptor